MGEIKVTREPYTRKSGTPVKGTTYMTEDKGKPGKTPASEKCYVHDVQLNWHKEDSPATRRANALKAHNGDELATARSLQELSNVTTDPETKKLTKEDADYFFAKHDAK